MKIKIKSIFVFLFIMVFIKLNANSFLTIHFHVINKTKNDLFLEYTLDKDFDFLGHVRTFFSRHKTSFFEKNT